MGRGGNGCEEAEEDSGALGMGWEEAWNLVFPTAATTPRANFLRANCRRIFLLPNQLHYNKKHFPLFCAVFYLWHRAALGATVFLLLHPAALLRVKVPLPPPPLGRGASGGEALIFFFNLSPFLISGSPC